MKGTHTDARKYALKLLSYRSRSEKEIRGRLAQKGFNNEQILSTLKFLSDTGLINDRILASDLMNYSVRRKPLGRQGIRMFLAKRGLDRELIESTLSAHTPEMEMQAAMELVERRSRILASHPETVIKRRLVGMLRRRGFPANVIHKALNSLNR